MYQRSSMVPRITQCKRHGRGAWGNRFAWTAWGRDAAGSFAWPIPFGGYKLGTAPAFNPSNSINLVSGTMLGHQLNGSIWLPSLGTSSVLKLHSSRPQSKPWDCVGLPTKFSPIVLFHQSIIRHKLWWAGRNPSYLRLQLFSWQSSPAAVREELQKRLVDMEKVLLWSHPVKIWTLQTESIHDNYW